MNVKNIILGERISLTSFINKNSFEVEIYIKSSLTIDISCFGLDSNKKLSDDKYMIFYNQKSSPEKAIELMESVNDNGIAKVVFKINISKIPTKIKYIVFTSTIDGHGDMSLINNGNIIIKQNSKDKIIFNINKTDYSKEKAIIIGEVYNKDSWKFNAVGKGFNGGLSALLKHFGGEEITEEKSYSQKNQQRVVGEKFFYSKLNQVEKNLYNSIYNGLTNLSTDIKISNQAKDNKINQIVTNVLDDNPSIFYVASSYTISKSDVETWYKPKYIYPVNKIKVLTNKLENMANAIIKNSINPRMNDYEKELAIHNYLVLNVSYDLKSLSKKTIPPEIFSAYGTLINNKAVCEGYAKATKLLLDKCGIECIKVSGTSYMPETNNSVGHAWNIVKLNNKYYQLDVTWDSPINKKSGELNFSYFNLTDKELELDHKWKKGEYPRCTSTELNYFNVRGLIISDITMLSNKIETLIVNRQSVLFFKFNSRNKINTSTIDEIIKKALSNSNYYGRISWLTKYNNRQKIFNITVKY